MPCSLLSKQIPYLILPLQLTDEYLEKTLNFVETQSNNFAIFNQEFLSDDLDEAATQIEADSKRKSTQTLKEHSNYSSAKNRKKGRTTKNVAPLRRLYGKLRVIKDDILGKKDWEIYNLVGLLSEKGCKAQMVHTDCDDEYDGEDFVSGMVALEEGTKLRIVENRKRGPIEVPIPKGCAIFWWGKMKHSGCAYPEKKNTRIHFYFAKKNNEGTGERNTADFIATAKVQKIYVCESCGWTNTNVRTYRYHVSKKCPNNKKARVSK